MRTSLKKMSVAGALAALGVCFSGPAYAVGNGIVDTGNQYPYVVSLTNLGAPRPFCSGTLITPQWVVSAQHCFIDGNGNPINRNFIVELAADPQSAQLSFAHTTAVSGPVFVPSTVPIDWIDDDLLSRDIAVFRLDTRVPRTLARPLHLPDEDACGSSFDGTIVGFGSGADDLIVCSDVPPLRRYSHSPLEYDRSHEDYGDIFYDETIWTLINWPFICDEYDGSYDGDSGGALLDEEGRLCGAVSGKTTASVWPGTYIMENVFAALDSGEARGFMLGATTPAGNRIIDAKGNFDGECPRFVDQCDNFGQCDETDTDVDGIIDVCDNCPTIANPEQAIGAGDDPDGDGLGAACDLCPGTVSVEGPGPLSNCNFEAELAVGYRTESEPPIIRADSPTLAADLQLYKDTFRPNACDPVPCPRATLTDGGSLPAAEIPPLPLTSPTCTAVGGCRWEMRNQITLKPTIGIGGDVLGTPGALRARWCECPFYDTSTLEGRLECDTDATTGCGRLSKDFTSLPNWHPLSTRADGPSSADGGWANGKTLDKLHSVQFTGAPDILYRTVYWDFLDLGTSFVHTSPTSRWVQGVLFVHATGYLPQVAGYDTAQALKYGNYYLSGDASIVAGDRPPVQPGAITLDTKRFCPECPLSFADTFHINDPHDPTRRVYQATPNGLKLAPGITTDTEKFYRNVANGTFKYIAAAEPLRRLIRDRLPGETILRGVALDAAGDSQLAAHVFSAQHDGAPFVVPFAGVQGSTWPLNGPELQGNEGLVLSATNRRLFVIGGTTEGQAGSQPNPSAWMLDVDSALWSEIEIPGNARPGAVLGATFRLEDRFVYLIDNGGNFITLRRWKPNHEVETLAELPVWWNHFERYWLVPGEAGDLVLAATAPASSTSTDPEAAFARFTISATGALSFAGHKEAAHHLIGAPMVGEHTIALTRAASVDVASTAQVSLASFGTPASNKIPTIF
ncbi:trypsin-like serine protease [Sorangium sp. So ce693]|uniref:trypsin-like serine protease n=1 Tax=Sorangium sp. So ce693 TaxID=3133318 RepID=UPI003F5EC2DF